MAAYDIRSGDPRGGAAGLTAAAGFGAIRREDSTGGEGEGAGGADCLHFGCVPSKSLIRTAGVWSLARRAKEFGSSGSGAPAGLPRRRPCHESAP